ncbi:hypothetical protein RRG08_022523 [Elysia crispata]|uniref:Uncharacterized protein n=1 Tax=Elysia crispata TaxID=231223 RepID=A0AAE0Z1C4_9GAST|nr:hypothetical protein RRG08_022523 [Elysia crispata]
MDLIIHVVRAECMSSLCERRPQSPSLTACGKPSVWGGVLNSFSAEFFTSYPKRGAQRLHLESPKTHRLQNLD